LWDLFRFTQQGASQAAEPPQGAGITSTPRDIEHPTSLIAKSSGLTEQEAITGKLAEVDPMVQKLPTANPELFGDAKRKFKKLWLVTVALGAQCKQDMKPLLGLQLVLKDQGVTLPHSNLPKSPGLQWNLVLIRKLSSVSRQPYSRIIRGKAVFRRPSSGLG